MIRQAGREEKRTSRDRRGVAAAAVAERFAALVVCLVVSTSVASAAAQAQLSGAETPVDVLLGADEVHDAAIGFGSWRSPVYDAFARLYWEGPSAAVAAERLVESRSPAARVYGYLILLNVAPEVARRYSATLLADATPVPVATGCLVGPRTVAEIVAAVDAGEPVITLPPEPRDRAWRVRLGPEPPEAAVRGNVKDEPEY